jgi:hypothetical protein
MNREDQAWFKERAVIMRILCIAMILIHLVLSGNGKERDGLRSFGRERA